ncbi:hypothetical protein SAY87_027154 [Trapa incisa]|uniref:Uncharacterized protein n=1 Tax=Trapa incisa TaxID=236973 RepID=A0AAN7GMY3_9MYRT|nr:hypothetical protein SAY87_027154 [Trapa incisa]
MEARSSLLRFLVVLALVDAARCRPVVISTDQKINKGRLMAKYSTSFSPSFSSAMFSAARLRDGEVSSLHTVSHRLVPSGPNPLHN